MFKCDNCGEKHPKRYWNTSLKEWWCNDGLVEQQGKIYQHYRQGHFIDITDGIEVKNVS